MTGLVDIGILSTLTSVKLLTLSPLRSQTNYWSTGWISRQWGGLKNSWMTRPRRLWSVAPTLAGSQQVLVYPRAQQWVQSCSTFPPRKAAWQKRTLRSCQKKARGPGKQEPDHKPAMHPCSRERANGVLACIRSAASRLREVNLPLHGLWKWRRHWSFSAIRKGGWSWDCSAWRIEGSVGSHQWT